MSFKVTGLLLAGGTSSRLGGGDKALRLLGGRPLLDHVLERFAPQVDPLLFNTNGDPARFAPRTFTIVADTLPDHPGPLAGVLAGLEWIKTHGAARWLAVCPIDTPFLPLNLVARFVEHAEQAMAPAAYATSNGAAHPVFSLWRSDLTLNLHRALMERGERKVRRFLADVGAIAVDWPGEVPDPFFNVNTPDDLERAEQLLNEKGREP